MRYRANRLDQLPPYPFARLDAKKADALASGVDVIDFGVGDPDLPSPPDVVQALCEAARKGRHHGYPPYRGTADFREACADWLAKRFGVSVDPDKEVIALIGSKEGLVHLALSVVSPGDVVLCPNPAYPVYRSAAVISGGEPVSLPLLPERSFLPDLSSIDEAIAKRAKLMFLNYPNNPTGACASAEFLTLASQFAREHDIALCHDAAYIETVLDGSAQPCLLASSSDRRNLIEFFSLSKTFNMTGWRVGFAAGDSGLIEALASMKNNLDSGVFVPIQIAAIEAMRSCGSFTSGANLVYRERAELLVPALKALGLSASIPRATFYIWARLPGGVQSADYSEHLLDRFGILATPGTAFGEHGEGYVRFSLTLSTERVREAVERLR